MKIKFWFLLAGCCLLLSCKDDDPVGPDIPDGSPDYCFVNKLIADCQEVYYLWNKEIDLGLDVYSYSDPFDYFREMIYKDDKWSTLTDDIESLSNSFAGVETTYGYSLEFAQFQNVKDVFAIVQFVYRDSPAWKAGLKRGDIIWQMNGKNMTLDNYRELYYSPSVTIGLGEYNAQDHTIRESGNQVPLTAITMYQDPIIATKIIQRGNHTIGYLHYSDYTRRSHSQLQKVIKEFREAGVTDMVLDLRYNPGGYSITSQFLCSMLVPSSVVKSKSIYLTEQWNQYWMDYYKDTNTYFTYDYRYSDEDGKTVTEKIEHNLELNDIYILTGSHTASASEATIVGLSPYLDVKLIGSKTSGKYCGGILATAKQVYSGKRYPGFLDNCGIYTMVYRFDNKDPRTTFDGPISPDIAVEEDLLKNSAELGDEKEELLAVAIARITGEPVAVASPRTFSTPYHKLPAVQNRVQQVTGGMIETGKMIPEDYK